MLVTILEQFRCLLKHRQKLSCENVLHKLTVYTGICVSTMAFSDFNKQKTDRLKGF